MKSIQSNILVVALLMVACFVSFHVGRISGMRIVNTESQPRFTNVNFQEAALSNETPQGRQVTEVQNNNLDQNHASVVEELFPAVPTNSAEREKITATENVRAMVKAITDAEITRYYPNLEAIGLTHEQIQLIHTNSLLVHEKANQANSSIEELSRKRAEHDSIMKKALSPEQYKDYINFEMNKPFRVELEEAIEPLLANKGIDLGESKELIFSAMKQFGATSLEFSHGPYDGNPRPAATFQEVLPHYMSEASRLRTATDQFLNAINQKVSEDVFSSIKGYFEMRNHDFEARTKPHIATGPMSEESVHQLMIRQKETQPSP